MAGFAREWLKHALPEPVLAHLRAYDHLLNGEPELRLLKRFCSPHKCSIDVGANIGTYTYFMRRYSRRVIAFEPNPELAKRLRKLFPDVDVRNLALSDRAGNVKLAMPVIGGRPAHELGSIAQSFDAEGVVEHEVQCVPLDSQELDEVGFLKIDVEQHEREVLQGALATIQRCQPIVMTEATPLLYTASLPETFLFLVASGYRGWFTFQGQPLPFDAFDPEVHAHPERFGTADFMNTNVFFVPPTIRAETLLRYY
jgi:FkbM family methyltransferase